MARVVVRWVPWVCGETVLTHPTPPSPFISLNYASSWGKRFFSACSKFVMDSVVAMLAPSIQIGRPFGGN